METVNPYEPPRTDSRPEMISDLVSVGTITSRFDFTPKHLIDTLERFRSQGFGRRFWNWFRYFAAFIFLLIAVGGLIVTQYWATIFGLTLTMLMFFSYKIDDKLAVRNFKKSPHYNAEYTIYLSTEGFRAESEIEQTNIKWSAFTKAIIFDDGVLLYRGTNVVNWIPDITLSSKDEASRLRQLLYAKLPTTRAVNVNRRW